MYNKFIQKKSKTLFSTILGFEVLPLSLGGQLKYIYINI